MNFNALNLISSDSIVVNRTLRDNEAWLGATLFPARKKVGITLDWIKTYKGRSVELMPSNLDAVPVIRQRGTFAVNQNRMAFYREAMQVKEEDMVMLAQIESKNAPAMQQIMDSIYDDANELINGAETAAEAMRMQLLHTPQIAVAGDNVNIVYNYDPDGSWATNNTATGSDWTDTTNSTPLTDLINAVSTLQTRGLTPRYVVMNPATFLLAKKSAEVLGAIISVAGGIISYADDTTVKEVIERMTGLRCIVYGKYYETAAGTGATKFYPDGKVSILCDDTLGNTWYGTTPEERTMLMDDSVDVTMFDNRIAVTVAKKYGPPAQILTVASEMMLPSFERQDAVYVIDVSGN